MGFEILSLGNAANQPYSPLHLGQRTRLQGKPGLFVVVGMDSGRETVDLISSTGISRVLQHIPFTQIRPLHISYSTETDERTLPFPS